MIVRNVPYCWMVVYRDFACPGGIIDYGIMHIVDFYESYEEANEGAIEFWNNLPDGLVDPRVWVCCVERSFVRAKEGDAVLISSDAVLHENESMSYDEKEV